MAPRWFAHRAALSPSTGQGIRDGLTILGDVFSGLLLANYLSLTYSSDKMGGHLTKLIEVSCVKNSRNEEAKQGVGAVSKEKADVRALRRTRVAIPDRAHVSAEDVRAIRESNGVSQAVLALYLGTSTAAVTQWEQGLRTPTGATATLLSLIKRKGLEVLI